MELDPTQDFVVADIGYPLAAPHILLICTSFMRHRRGYGLAFGLYGELEGQPIDKAVFPFQAFWCHF